MLKGFYTTLETEEEEINYLDNDFNEIVINFVRIETAYLRCHTSFSLKSKLHKYIKTGCKKKVLHAYFA